MDDSTQEVINFDWNFHLLRPKVDSFGFHFKGRSAEEERHFQFPVFPELHAPGHVHEKLALGLHRTADDVPRVRLLGAEEPEPDELLTVAVTRAADLAEAVVRLQLVALPGQDPEPVDTILNSIDNLQILRLVNLLLKEVVILKPIRPLTNPRYQRPWIKRQRHCNLTHRAPQIRRTDHMSHSRRESSPDGV